MLKDLKTNFRNKERIFGSWTSIGHHQISDMLIKSGVSFHGIDLEHSTISQEQCQRIISTCHAFNIPCLPRVASHNSEMIRRLLDSGADGIIVPNVELPKQVEKIIEWIKYPPIGKRGYGIAKAQEYGHDFNHYISNWNTRSIIVIQIESIDAVNNIDDILAFEEIDAVMIGPYDISGSLGIPGQIGHELVEKAASKVIESCKIYGKSCGTQDVDPTTQSIQNLFNLGYDFIVLSSDVFILSSWAKKIKKIID